MVYRGAVYAWCPLQRAQQNGVHPTTYAAARNHHRCVEVLLNMSMDIEVNAVTNKGYTPLYLAVACNSALSVQMLVSAGGVESTDKPMSGYRSILDLPVEAPTVVPFANRAVDDRARNLGQPAYLGHTKSATLLQNERPKRPVFFFVEKNRSQGGSW